jgi:hypothetical protein
MSTPSTPCHDLHGWYQVQRWQSWYQGGSDTAYRADRID